MQTAKTSHKQTLIARFSLYFKSIHKTDILGTIILRTLAVYTTTTLLAVGFTSENHRRTAVLTTVSYFTSETYSTLSWCRTTQMVNGQLKTVLPWREATRLTGLNPQLNLKNTQLYEWPV